MPTKHNFLIIVLLNLSLLFVVDMLMILFVFFVISRKLVSSCLISIPFTKMLVLQLKWVMITNSSFLKLFSHLMAIVSLLTCIVKELSRVFVMILVAFFCMPIKLIMFGPSCFVHIIFTLHILKRPQTIEDKPTLFLSAPLLGPGSLHLKSRISRLIKQCYPGYKLQIGFSTFKRIHHFFPLGALFVHPYPPLYFTVVSV